MTSSPDYYAALGVPKDASSEEIRGAYRRLAKQWHPDRNSRADAGDQFRRIQEAYEVLSDPVLRAEYDRSLEEHAEYPEVRLIELAVAQRPPAWGWAILGLAGLGLRIVVEAQGHARG